MSRNTTTSQEVVTTDHSSFSQTDSSNGDSSSFKGKLLLSDAKMKKELKNLKTKVQDINADRDCSEKGSKLINVESLLEGVAASSSRGDNTPSSYGSTKKSSTKVFKFANRIPAGKFSLDYTFMLQMQKEKDPWSADETTDKPEDVLAALVYYRTYSRGGQPWWQCVQRVVEGTFRIQQDHFKMLRKKWDPRKAQKTAQEMYRRIFSMKFLPPGRGLWAMGTKIVEEKGLIAALNNCSFVSTKNIDKDFTYPFIFLMDASMLGVGVGTDMKGAGKAKIYRPVFPGETYLIPDSREGWVESVRMLLLSFSRNNRPCVYFDYSLIRKEGTPLQTFGGVSSGAGPLIKLHEDLRKTLERCQGSTLDTRGIADICNQIGVAVVSGNIRRTAEILFGEADDEDFLNLKNYEVFPERGAYGWTSNNSLYAKLGMDYSKAAERIRTNGEPGFIWLENAQAYSRMMDNEKDWKDYRAAGGNPCVSANTLIMTTNGLQCAGDLVGKPFTAIIRGHAYLSGKRGFWKTGEKQVICVQLANGMEIRVTENHKIKMKNDVLKEARDLEKGDLVELSCNSELDKLTYNGGRGTWEEGYILGSLVGDGTFTSSKGQPLGVISFWINKDLDILDHPPAKIVHDYLLQNMHFSYKGPTFGRNVGHDLAEYRFKAIALTELAAKFGIVQGNKKLPIVGLSYPFTRGLLSGLFDADGHLEFSKTKGSRSVRLGQSNMSLLKHVQIMLCNIGIISKIYGSYPERQTLLPDGKGGSKMYDCKAAFRLSIGQQPSIKRFSETIGFRDPTKIQKLTSIVESYTRNPNASEFFSGVSKIVVDRVEDVYDAEISDIHLFSGDGITVHNCNEQTLEDGEMCNLVETFPDHHENLKDYLETLRFAFLYAKTVTLLPSHWEKTNEVMLRNRRIGTSQSGLQQFVANRSIKELKEWCNVGYEYLMECDKDFSELFAVPRSIKITTIKPSGTVSLIAGATPGMHWPISNYYIRRVTLAKNSPYVQKLRDARYVVEESAYDPANSVVVEIPVCAGEKVRCQKDVSMWEQLEFAAFLQKHWADNQVSCTVTFDKEKEGSQIETALNHYQYRLKGISMLPSSETSKVYKVFGQFTQQHIRWLTPGAVGDDTFFPDLVKCKYNSDENSTLLEFDSHLSSEFIQMTLDNLKKAGKYVDSKSVTPYKQMPYETITKDVYLDMIKNIRLVEWHTEMYSNENIPKSSKMSLPSELMYCDGDKCVL